jgi:ubiquinol oxidase
MKRDNGWIGTLLQVRSFTLRREDPTLIILNLQEAENERMHLMTFMKIYNPGWMFRGLVLVTQGVFYNLLFVSYLLSPSAVHRFVGYLEEEAVVTYTQIVDEMERGHIPEWAPGAREVPQIAKDYWRMGPDATMKDLILAVRADESNHRYVLPSSPSCPPTSSFLSSAGADLGSVYSCTNHTLADLKPDDVNPFGFKHASPFLAGTTTGLTREESIEWAKKVEEEVRAGLRQSRKEDKKVEQKVEQEQKL